METLDQLAKKAIGLRPIERIRLVEFVHMEDATLIGAAIAGLTN